MNAMYKLAEDTIRENFEVKDNDDVIKFLQQAVVDEDEYLRYRILERFNAIMKSLFDAHKKDALSVEQTDILEEMKEGMQTYLSMKGSPERAKMILLAKQLNLNIAELPNEEIDILLKALERSKVYKNAKRRRK